MTLNYRSILDKKLKNNQVLIASHQGSAGGNIVYNTYEAMLNAINQGAHVVEFDISRSSDKVFHVFHENEEPIRFNKNNQFRTFTVEQIEEQTLLNMNMQKVQSPPTLKEFMMCMKKHPEVLLHFDHAQKWGKDLLEELDQYKNQRKTIIIKTDADSKSFHEALALHEIKYMTLLKVWNQDDFDKILHFSSNINIVGFEMIFNNAQAAYVSKNNLNNLRNKGYHTMVNALVLWNDRPSISGGFDDDVSLLKDPEKGWGILLSMGFDIIQTDWPLHLKTYLEKKGVILNYE